MDNGDCFDKCGACEVGEAEVSQHEVHLQQAVIFGQGKIMTLWWDLGPVKNEQKPAPIHPPSPF